jgi:6-phosphogluconate dehydrogenase
MELGIIGLGRMGGNISQRLMRAGHRTVVYDRNVEAVHMLADKGAKASSGLADMVAKLSPPRAVWVMLPAGKITETTVAELGELLSTGDTIIDGGNTFYKDDIRRARELAGKGITYVDVGTSGGIWGIERGYCMMIGGEEAAVRRLDPIFATLAPGIGTIERTPQRDGHDPRAEQGYIHVGPAGAGHFVKMVHNGIEYGLMQAYAEGFDILQSKGSDHLPEGERFDINVSEVAEVWRRGSVVSSWLLDLTAIALAKDGDLAAYQGEVEDSGEGRWTVEAAIEQAVPAPVITTSLFARFESRRHHSFANKLLSAMRAGFGGHVEPGTHGVIAQPVPKPAEVKVQEHERET